VIDIHSHILPGVDDGARSVAEALKMAEIAAADGIEQMVCTPHMFNGLSRNPQATEVEKRVEELQKAIGSGLTVLPGNEVHFSIDIASHVGTNRISTLNRQNYVLIEFPTLNVPRSAPKRLKQLSTLGVHPILVHPERNIEIQSRPSLVAELMEQGTLIQVTAMSVTGKFGLPAKTCVDVLLKHRCVHFIASDAHRPEKRPPVLSAARDAAAEIIGEEAARRLVVDNPRAVIEGQTIVPEAVVPFDSDPPSGTSFFSKIFSHS
jgi:protein-tyrosine phosphatase